MTEYERSSDERIDELVARFNTGKAGKGDSPYTQEKYEEIYGLRKRPSKGTDTMNADVPEE